jgi:hypothetical protein
MASQNAPAPSPSSTRPPLSLSNQRRHLDAWTLISYLAGRTDNVRFFPDVANLPLRHPGVLAKSAATLIEEIVKLVRDLRFDGFVAWFDDEDQLGQTERFAAAVAPAVRDALA